MSLTYCRLTQRAMFVAAEQDAWCLPVDTLIAVVRPGWPSRLTSKPDEIFAYAPSPRNGRLWPGWLAPATTLALVPPEEVPALASPKWSTVNTSNDGALVSALDELRWIVGTTWPRKGFDRFNEPVEPYNLPLWLCHFGLQHHILLTRVVTELAPDASVPTDANALIQLVIRLTTHEEITMSEISQAQSDAATAKAKTTASKSIAKSAKSKAKKSKPAKPAKVAKAKKEHTPRVPAGIVIGTQLVELKLLKGDGLAAAKALAAGETLKITALRTLKDDIKAAALASRQEKQSKAATQLSTANRLIRRLIRALA